MRTGSAVSSLLLVVAACGASKYEELVPRRLRFPSSGEPNASAAWRVLPFESASGVSGPWISTNKGIYRIGVNASAAASTWEALLGGGVALDLVIPADALPSGSSGEPWRLAADTAGNLKWAASASIVVRFDGCAVGTVSGKCRVASSVQCEALGKSSTTLEVDPRDESALVAGQAGIFRVKPDSTECGRVSGVPESPVTAATAWSTGMAAATVDKLYVESGGKWRYYWIDDLDTNSGGPIDGPVSTLAYDGARSALWIANDICVNRLDLKTSVVSRIGPLDGLPAANLSAVLVATGSSRVWTAGLDTSARAAVSVLDPDSGVCDAYRCRLSRVQYLSGNRWMPIQDRIIGISELPVPNPSGSIVAAFAVLTDAGLSVLTRETWTLEQKAELLEYQVQYVDRYGLTSECTTSKFLDATTCVPETSDNDGLWTSLLVAAESFRFAVTGDESARQAAWHHFSALELLVNSTGVPGLPARSVIDADTPIPSQGTWHPIKWREGWHWKGDTSSDEITGHLFAYSIFAQLVPKGDAEKKRALAPLEAIMSNLVKNNLTLIDITGLPTTWGRWDPETINDVRDRSDGRGVNSLQIIAYLASAYRCTGEVKYQDAARALLAQGYDHNLINLKIENPGDDNFSDDELTFLPYFEFLWDGMQESAFRDMFGAAFNSSLRRTFDFVRASRSDLWSAVFLAATGGSGNGDQDTLRAQAQADLVWNLETWPLEVVNYPVNNSARVDVLFNPLQDRFHRSNNRGLSVLPANERSQLRWNANPFELQGGDPHNAKDPAAWLLPYWMARYYKLVQS